MLDARQIRDAEFIKNSVKRRAKTEAQQFLERTAGTVEQLQNENASVRAENIELNERCERLKELNEKLTADKDELLQKLSETAENTELNERCERLNELNEQLSADKEELLQRLSEAAENTELNERCEQLKALNEQLVAENNGLLQKLSEAAEAPAPVYQPEPEPVKAPDYTAEAERIIKAAQDKAGLILEQAERDYLVKMNRANAAFTQKTIAFEREFGDSLRKLKVADGELRELKARLVKLLEEMPDGIGENAAEIIDRLKNQE